MPSPTPWRSPPINLANNTLTAYVPTIHLLHTFSLPKMHPTASLNYSTRLSLPERNAPYGAIAGEPERHVARRAVRRLLEGPDAVNAVEGQHPQRLVHVAAAVHLDLRLGAPRHFREVDRDAAAGEGTAMSRHGTLVTCALLSVASQIALLNTRPQLSAPSMTSCDRLYRCLLIEIKTEKLERSKQTALVSKSKHRNSLALLVVLYILPTSLKPWRQVGCVPKDEDRGRHIHIVQQEQPPAGPRGQHEIENHTLNNSSQSERSHVLYRTYTLCF